MPASAGTLNKLGRWLLLVAVGVLASGTIGLLLSLITVSAFNSEFRAAEATSRTVGNVDPERPLAVTLVIRSLDEQTNSAEATLQVTLRPSPLLDSTVANKYSVTFHLGPSLGDLTLEPQVTLVLDAHARRGPFNEGLSVVSPPFTVQTTRGINPFPFDDHDLFLVLWNRGSDHLEQYFSLTVVKRRATRIVSLEGKPETPRIRLARPAMEKLFVLFASVIFVVIVTVLAWRLYSDRALGGFEELLGVAG